MFSQYGLSQSNKDGFTLSVGAGLISSSKIFPNPNSSNIVERNKSFEIENIFSPSLEVKYRFNEEVSIGISSEYAVKMKKGNYVTALSGSQIVELESEDGFEFIPVELSVYQTLPFSTESFYFNIGGGFGYYIAKMKRNFGDTKISAVESTPVFGIQVSASVEYKFIDKLSLFLQTKYRAPEIKVKNRYDKNVVNYQGRTITILQNTFDSKIGVNGVVLMLGIIYNLN
jgi:hypothetical protein